jgi:nucleotide-binding universal stress UspA family protein
VSVLAYIDGSGFTESVAHHAAWAARQLGTGVQLVNVMDYWAASPASVEDHLPGSPREDLDQLNPEIMDSDRRLFAAEEEEHRQLLLDVAREIKGRDVNKVQTSLEFGPIENHIREHGQKAQLAVIGKRGEQSAERSGDLGDHLERVIRSAPCPLLIAPSEAREIRRYMVAFDGGTQSGHAVRFLAEHPLLQDQEGTLLLVGDHPGLSQQLNDAASHLRAAGHHIQAERAHGNPDRLIPDILNTEDIDLLVMGAFSHSRLQNLFGRSTTRSVLRSSSKAILIVR